MSTNAVNSLPQTITALEGDKTAVDRAEVTRLAQQFEAMLMTQMLREMRRSMLESQDDGEGLGASAMTDTADIEFGLAMSRGGGLGLTAQLQSAFEQQVNGLAQGATPLAEAATPGVTPALSGLAPPEAGAHVSNQAWDSALAEAGSSRTWGPASAGPENDPHAAHARVSSGFGWRRDPFTGAAQFHKGVDLALAYGHEVKAPAAGTVAFAGVQGSYGQTVVIDHGNGRQTRYAHLSDALVRTGDRVAEGQVVAKSGNSGRSTGAHLHVERLVDGQPVDPLGALAD